jgi:hypothetical protein
LWLTWLNFLHLKADKKSGCWTRQTLHAITKQITLRSKTLI